MDQEYLQNVLGSPYVNEGAFGQLKAKTAQAMGAVGTMAGEPIRNPTETKLRSLWEGFMSSLKKIMTDWKGVSDNSFDARVQLDDRQQQAKDSLDALARLLSSSAPQNPLGSRNANDLTQVKGSAYNRSTTSPPKPTPTKLTEIMGEGFWNRDVKLNKALGSNDPSTILDSYKNQVLSVFQNFMKDAVKMTKMKAQQIYGMLAKMQPAQSGWQAAGNMQKVVTQLKTLQSIGDIKGQGTPPIINPPAGAEATPPVVQQPPNAGQPPATPQQPQAEQPPTEQPQAGSNAPAAGSGVQGGEWNIPSDKLPYVIRTAMKQIIDTVSSDTEHVGGLFTKSPTGEYPTLPTSTSQPSLPTKPEPPHTPGPTPPTTKITELEDDAEDAEDTGGSIDMGDNEEEPFLYRFRSKLRKYPAGKFTIEVKKENTGDDGVPVGEEWPGVNVRVWWNNEKHTNQIYAVAMSQGKKSNPVLIMSFFDHHVDSKAGATTPNHTNAFSIDKIIKSTNPNAGPGEGKLDAASKQVRNEIKGMENDLLRSLYAVAVRKSMEFVPKVKTFELTFDEAGTVFTNVHGEEKAYEANEVKANLNDKTGDGSPSYNAKRWRESLKKKGYFKKFNVDPLKGKDNASGTPSTPSSLPAIEAAVIDLVNKGWQKKTAYVKLASVVDRLKKFRNDGDVITPEEMVTIVMDPLKMPVPPAFRDAVEARKNLGDKPDDADQTVMAKWLEFKKTTPVEKIDGEELIKAVISGKTQSSAPAPTPTAKKTPEPQSGATVSKPAGQPAPATKPTTPVSSPAGGPAPTTKPTAPVSTDQPKPDQGKQPPAEQPPQQGQPKDKPAADTGKVDIKGDDLEWESPDTHEIHSISPDQVVKYAKTKPKFLAALKAHPDVYNKYKDMINQKIAQKKAGGKKPEGGEKPPVKEHLRLINPFNRDNLLY